MWQEKEWAGYKLGQGEVIICERIVDASRFPIGARDLGADHEEFGAPLKTVDNLVAALRFLLKDDAVPGTSPHYSTRVVAYGDNQTTQIRAGEIFSEDEIKAAFAQQFPGHTLPA